MAPGDSRSVSRYGPGHLACRFLINVTVPAIRLRLGLWCGIRKTAMPAARVTAAIDTVELVQVVGNGLLEMGCWKWIETFDAP